MSAILARHMMTHRCDTTRDANRGLEDEAGNPLAPDPQPHLVNQACYLHADFRSGFSGEFDVGGSDFQVTRTLYRLMVPRGTDINNFDQITVVRNKFGSDLYNGILEIDNFEFAEYYTVYYLTERR